MPLSARILSVLVLLILTSSVSSVSEESFAARPSGQRAADAKPGGRLVISKSAGPRTFNRLLSFDDQSNTVTDCLMGYLVKINRQTQRIEPELATSWKASPDRRTLTFDLRRDVKFSDGAALTADDVVFTFQIINDPKIATSSSEQFIFEGQRVKIQKLADYTIAFTFPVPYATALRLFDGIPVLPRHILEPPYREGKFEQAWTLATPPERLVGLGPFKLKSYVAGQRVVLARNENYWKSDASGKRLPYLDEIVFSLDSDRNTQLLKFQSGETDLLSPVTAEDVASFRSLEQQGKIKVFNLGPGLIREIFWFNLNSAKNSASGQPYVDPVKLSWFKEVKFRQAISHAIDREAISNLAFSGKATPQWGFVSAGDKLWVNAAVKKYPHDMTRAKSLLAESGFRFDSSKKQLFDREGREVTFTLATNAGNQIRQKISAVIQEDLSRIGIKVNLAFIESRTLLSRINDGAGYEACLLAILGDADPSSYSNILLTRGSQHWWQPKQAQPATPWEARIDELMKRQLVTTNVAARKKLFDEVQAILAEQQPFIFLVSRHLIVAAKTAIGNLKPALLPDFVLWNVDELYRR